MRKIMFCSGKSNKARKRETTDTSTEQQVHTFPAYRYVVTPFERQVKDEISAYPGDVVVYQYSDTTSTGEEWSFVIHTRTGNAGFVPSDVLSEKPGRERPSKIPRSKGPPRHKDLLTPHDQPATASLCNSIQHQPKSYRAPSTGMPQHFSPPAYYNVRTTEVDYHEFHRANQGVYLVTNKFIAKEENDLSVDSGEYVTVLNKDDDDWFWVRRDADSAEGFVPRKFVCHIEQVKAIINKGNSTVTMKSSIPNECHTYINHRIEKDTNDHLSSVQS